MSFEQSAAGVLVDCICVVVVQVLNALLEARVLQTLVDRVGKELNVCVE